MRRLHLIQLDSVPVVIRTQYMPGFSRLGPYDPDLLDDIAYGRDEWFEAYVHEASVLPVEDEPYVRFTYDRIRSRDEDRLPDLVRTDPDYVDQVLAEVVERGPMRAGDLSEPRRQKGEWWDGRSLGTQALNWLYRIGDVGIRREGNFEKVFDLRSRIIPDHVQAVPTPSPEDSMKHLLVQSAKALGVATSPELTDYFRLPKQPVKPLFAELVEDGRLVECESPGTHRPLYMHPDTVVPRSMDARALLSPFDPVVWHRDRASWMFDFDYRIEIYVPKPKRVFGYYVLPFLLGDRLVARCDLKTDRGEGVLRLLAAFPEPGVDEAAIAPELADELQMLATMVGVDRVVVDGRSSLDAAVAAALR